MTLELFLWILAGIVVSEILFIFAYKNDWFGDMPWGAVKLLSFLIGILFTSINLAVVYPMSLDDAPKYINLLWFYLVLAIIGLLILINYKIAKWLDKK